MRDREGRWRVQIQEIFDPGFVNWNTGSLFSTGQQRPRFDEGDGGGGIAEVALPPPA